jgi:hypothetical protein
MDKLKEDTVSADRKERIIFDPDAWRKSDKSGKKTSAITSRQNFDNEKFTRKADKVDEGTIQPSGDSKVDSAGPTQSDTISQDAKVKKSNNPQIEFVTGNVNPNGSSSTAIGNQPMTGRKLAETLIKKAVQQVSEGRMKDKVTAADFEPKATNSEKPPFDGPYTKSPDVVVDKSGARHTPMSRARDLARKAIAKKQVKEAAQYAGLEKEDKPGKVKTAVVKTHPKAVEIETVEGWKDEKKPVKEAVRIVDPLRKKVGDINYGKKDGSFQGEMERKQLARAAKDRRSKTQGSGVSGFNSKLIDRSGTTETGRVRAVKEEAQLEEGNGYDDNRTGFAKPPRENDEGHQSSGKPSRKDFMNDRPHAVHIDGKKWKTFPNGHQAKAAVKTLEGKGKKAVAIAQFKEEEETTMSKTYTEFMDQLLEYTPGPGGVTKVKGRSYGANYDAGEDDDDKPKAAPSTEPKKRGRPKNSGSGANHKVTSGKSYGGIATHSLNLPNSNR